MHNAVRERARRSSAATFKAFEVSINAHGYGNWHYHDDCEIVAITAGSGTRFIGDSIEEYRAGEVVLVGPGVPHTWCPARGDDSGGSAEVLHLDPSALDWPELGDLARLVAAAGRGLLFPPDTLTSVRCHLIAVRRGTPAQQAVAALTVLAELADRSDAVRPLSQREYQARPQRPGVRRSDAAARLETIRNVVADRLAEPLVQGDIARDAGMTPAAFCRFFRRQTGRTFTRYVQEVRLAEASRLLAETDMGITEIATSVGFANLAHFNRCFKRHKGQTPTTWRRATRTLTPAT